MRLPKRLPPRARFRKPALAGLIAVIASVAAIWLSHSPVGARMNDTVYDATYDLRRPADERDSPVVIVTANDASLQALAHGNPAYGWPWPRQFWGFAIDYVQKCGAKAVGVDLLFTEPSTYSASAEFADDETFASKLDTAMIPVILAAKVNSDGSSSPFVPPVKRRPIFGAVDINEVSARDYPGTSYGTASLALRTVQAVGVTPPSWAAGDFRLHYYGRHINPNGKTTFRYVSAADVFREAMPLDLGPPAHPFDPSIFKDKIVLFGTTATATYDVKASPLDQNFPGVEIHATAIENMLRYQRVRVVGDQAVSVITVLACIAAAVGAMAPRRTWMKLLMPMLATIVLALAVVILFRRENIIWLPPLGPLMGIGAATVLAPSWSYFAEDRQARFFLRALGQYVSPHVASELKSHPEKLAISTEKGEVTILFSDIVGFTALSEELEEGIGKLLNFYLDEMSEPVLAEDGTLDKYIGDAIMSFWNAPVAQADHAVRACRAALAMRKRLVEIQPRLAELGAPNLSMRIGVNTGTCMFGNMGSRSKFSYSIIGDSCNFASRLEGANKIYHTNILIGESTWNLVWDRFVTRKVDVVKVQGKQKPVAIFELMAEGLPEPATADLINKYESAYRLYCQSDWDSAEKLLLDILAAFPQDGPSRELLARIADFRAGPAPEFWDGVYVAKHK